MLHNINSVSSILCLICFYLPSIHLFQYCTMLIYAIILIVVSVYRNIYSLLIHFVYATVSTGFLWMPKQLVNLFFPTYKFNYFRYENTIFGKIRSLLCNVAD